MNNDGTGVKQLTFNYVDDWDPCWSPDGEWIAFVSNDSVWVIKKDGTGLRQVTTPPVFEWDNMPSWSPDGSTILFVRNSDVYEIDALSTGLGTKLIDGAHDPAWSPDGSMIAYENQTDNKIWVADSSTGVPLFRVTSDDGRHPCWSPDGKRIAYAKSGEISLIDLGGSNDQQISNPPIDYDDESPNWSPDGEKILFDREEPAVSESVWVVNIDGTNEQDLTPSMIEARDPDWQAIPLEDPEPVGGELLTNNIPIMGAWMITCISTIALSIGVIHKKRKRS